MQIYPNPTEHSSMTSNTDDMAPIDSLEPITGIDPLIEHKAISYQEMTDTVPDDIVETMQTLPDMAAVGIRNDDGEALMRRLTETCSWKVPVVEVEADACFATAIREHVFETLDRTLTLSDIVGIWEIRVRSEQDDRNASRAFVVFDGDFATTGSGFDGERSTTAVEEVSWFRTVPENAEVVPGTDRFFE